MGTSPPGCRPATSRRSTTRPTALNRLASRVVELLGLEREEVADLAHRLRTPVAALRLDADSLPEADSTDRLRADVDRLDSGWSTRSSGRPVARCARTSPTSARPVRGGPRARRVLGGPGRGDQDRALTVDIPPGPLLVAAEGRDLGDALDALIGNVFSTHRGRRGLPGRGRPRPGTGAWLEVSDEGPGFASSAVLERGLSVSGSTGLGLDIAAGTARAAGGSLRLERSDGLGGTRVVIDLPRAEDTRSHAP